MLKRPKLASILMTLCVLLSIHGLAATAFAQCSATCGGTGITCTSSIVAADPDSSWRWAFGDPQSTCAVPTTCSDNNNTYNYDFYQFTNNTGGATPDCFTITLTNTACAISIGSAAFLGNFPTAANSCALATWLGDSGTGISSGSKVYSVNVANGATVTVAVTTSTNNAICTGGGLYSINISPCPGATTAAGGVINGRITASDGMPLAGTVANLSGSQTRKTITDANGNYHFDAVETNGFYTLLPSRSNYIFNPGNRSFGQLGNSTEALFTGEFSNTGANPIDTAEYFVRQHYIDFLGREPDEPGFNYWSDQILACGHDAVCAERKAINVSAAYFLSIEFQETGGLVDALYRASFGRRPLYAEFMPDTKTVAQNVMVGRIGWEQQLSQNKQEFLDGWVQRSAFRATYDFLTNDRFVDTLIANTGVNYAADERDALVMGLNLGSLSRVGVLQRVATDSRFAQEKRNDAFVMMEYFGYLRRDPDAAGFQYWLNKLDQFNGNFERADMVRAFIVSSEFRSRFPN
jgi:hypothetical protein